MKTSSKVYDRQATKAFNHIKAAQVAARKYGANPSEGFMISQGDAETDSLEEMAGEMFQAAGDSEYRVALAFDALAKLETMAKAHSIPAKAHSANVAKFWAAYSSLEA